MRPTLLPHKKKVLLNKETLVAANTSEQVEPLEPDTEVQSETSPVLGKADSHAFTVVAIGASAGGLEAITQLLQNLSPTTGMAFIYVQHLSPDHKSMLTPILSKTTSMKVQDIDDMEKMIPNNVYIIPYNKEIEVINGHIQLLTRPRNKTSNLSIDVLFSSLAETHKENVIGVVLSGSANDGTRGLREIKLLGGITFAQDDSAKFTSMPHSAIAEGVVDFVLSPIDIAKALNTMSKNPLIKPDVAKPALEDEIDNADPDLKTIIQFIHKIKNVDFSHYKMNTIKRRMLRRMLIHDIKTIKEYAALLGQDKKEIDLLYQDLLINVTDFFRDTDAFLNLKNTVLPRLLKSKTMGETLRIWVAACATGAEVYSIGMLLFELQENNVHKIPFQIFASDLSAEAISEARIGEYSVQQLKNVSPKHLQQFFIKSKDKYRILKSLRDVCVFAQHNVLSDPPFSRIDFISCRNLLIYLDTSAQKKAISTFHYALNDNGCLMLGKSETIGTSTQLFTPLSKKYKIYGRKKVLGTFRIPDPTPRQAHTAFFDKERATTVIPKKTIANGNGNLGSTFDAILLNEYVPASVIINHDLEILQFRGATSLYLQQASGKASFNILKMAHSEITFELRNAIHHAIKTKQTVRKTGIEMNRDKAANAVQIVNIEVNPLKIEGDEPLLIVVFTGQQMEIMETVVEGEKNNSIAKDRRIKKLEEELAAARFDMGTIVDDQEAANEELQSANEEIVSSNEELQSLNEELETSKEEIESTNEELVTSNQELHARIQQVEELHNYNEAIVATIHEPMLILDKNIRVKSVNKSFCKTFQISEEDVTGVLLYKLSNNHWNIPRLRELLEDVVPNNTPFHNFEVQHTFPVVGHKILLLNAHRIVQLSHNEELIILTIVDITEVRRLAIELQLQEKKALEEQLEAEKETLKKVEDSNKRYNMMVMQSPFAFAVLKGKDMVIHLANDSIKELWGKGKDIEGKPLLDVLPEIKDTLFPPLLDKVYTTGIPFYGNETLAQIQREGKLEDIYFNFVYQPYLEADETISGVTIIAFEVTAQVTVKKALEKQHEAEKKALQKIEESNKRYYTMLMESPIAFSIMKGKDMVVTLANDLMKEFWGKGKEVEGKTLLELLPELTDQPFPELIDKVYTTGKPIYVNEILAKLKHNGELQDRYFNIVYQPYLEEDDTILGVTTIAYEVTEMVLTRKKIEEREKLFGQVIDSMPQKITNADADGNIFFFNQQWIEQTGYTLEELKGWGWEKAIHPDDLKNTKDSWIYAVKTITTFEVECRIVHIELGYRWNLSRAVPIRDKSGKITMWVGSHTDIHEQKEAKLKAEASTKIAEEAVKSKQQFLSNMSHEIRTPMNAIIGFTNVVLKTPLDETQKEYINAIKVSGDALIVLINDILDLAKVDAGKMTFEQKPFNLSTAISNMLQLFEPKIREKNLALLKEYDDMIPPMVVGDPMRLRQIILNLISNAVKFTAKGAITIRVRLLKEEAEHTTIEFELEDTGIGIREDRLEHIFNNFEQASKETSSSYGGTGLGLAIVKQLVELQGGTMSVNSELGKGSTFRFVMGFAKTQLKKEKTTTSKEEVANQAGDFEEKRVNNVKVLVAEDIVLNQLLIKIILLDFGFDIDIVANGKIAIEHLQKNTYDIVLMDLQMPEMNGFEATLYIRNTLQSQIPIIALTADVTTVDVEKCMAVGMNDYISKPIDEKLLYSKISKYVKIL